MTDPSFPNLYKQHNGEHYLAPTDLALTPEVPRRVLIVGSCLAEVWKSQIDCPCDFVLTNNLNELPEAPPQPVENYDLQLVQIPLRLIIPDDAFWHTALSDIAVFEQAFDDAVARMRAYLSLSMRWNREHGFLTLVANFFVPQQNAIGRFAPRYDIRNPIYFVEQMNRALVEEIATYENSYLLDIDAIASVVGKKHVQDDATELQTHASLLGNTHHAKDRERIEPPLPMTQHYELHREKFLGSLWRQAAAMYKTIRQTDAVKLVIVDLDNTLWRGVVAESGDVAEETLEGWPLGLIEALSYLKKRGILLAIASQNEESRLLALWDKIMRGLFKLEDFAVVKIDWRTKMEKIDEILQLTNLLPRNAVFIDDNPVERAAVQAAFPDIRTLGQYPYYLKRILLWSPETQTVAISGESARRTEMIRAQANRETERKHFSRADFLASLNLDMQIIEIDTVFHENFARAFELINKTNQFNTTGKRWTHEECRAAFKKDWIFYAFTAKDRFADYGLVGCALVSGDVIEQFVMSCRVIGLDIENKIIAAIVAFRGANGAESVTGRLIETDANFPARTLFKKCGFEKSGENWVMIPEPLRQLA